MLYKVIILYFKCVLKRKQRSNAPLNISYSLCNHGNVCVWACVLHGYVCICSCAFKSAMTYREPFWVTLLPNVILFLLALLILWVIILKKKQKTNLVCIYRFVLCVYVFYINNTLWNRNTQHPAIFLAFGPFFCIIPCSTFLLQILHNPSMW